MNRYDLQELAQLRLREAVVLLEAGYPSGAYYLAGYTVECALKAVVARSTQQYEFPDKQRAVESFVHDLGKLSIAAKLTGPLKQRLGVEPDFSKNWATVSEWSVESRYSVQSREEAQDMIAAVSESRSGVLAWITQYW